MPELLSASDDLDDGTSPAGSGEDGSRRTFNLAGRKIRIWNSDRVRKTMNIPSWVSVNQDRKLREQLREAHRTDYGLQSGNIDVLDKRAQIYTSLASMTCKTPSACLARTTDISQAN